MGADCLSERDAHHLPSAFVSENLAASLSMGSAHFIASSTALLPHVSSLGYWAMGLASFASPPTVLSPVNAVGQRLDEHPPPLLGLSVDLVVLFRLCWDKLAQRWLTSTCPPLYLAPAHTLQARTPSNSWAHIGPIRPQTHKACRSDMYSSRRFEGENTKNKTRPAVSEKASAKRTMHKVYLSFWRLSVKSIITHKVNFTYSQGITVASRRKVKLLL